MQTQKDGKCLPLPPICDGSGGAAGMGNGPITCLEKCEVIPPTVDFTPQLKHSWGEVTSSPFTSDVMMTPIVIDANRVCRVTCYNVIDIGAEAEPAIRPGTGRIDLDRDEGRVVHQDAAALDRGHQPELAIFPPQYRGE